MHGIALGVDHRVDGGGAGTYLLHFEIDGDNICFAPSLYHAEKKWVLFLHM